MTDAPTTSLPQPEGETAERTLSGETVYGIPVAAYMEENEFGGTFATHWSTIPEYRNPVRLFREADVASLSQRLAAAEARLAVVEAERNETRKRFSEHVDYSIDLSRIIEALCDDRDPAEPRTPGRVHYNMAIAHRRAAEAQIAHARERAFDHSATSPSRPRIRQKALGARENLACPTLFPSRLSCSPLQKEAGTKRDFAGCLVHPPYSRFGKRSLPTI